MARLDGEHAGPGLQGRVKRGGRKGGMGGKKEEGHHLVVKELGREAASFSTWHAMLRRMKARPCKGGAALGCGEALHGGLGTDGVDWCRGKRL